jgi:hypothetical protein
MRVLTTIVLVIVAIVVTFIATLLLVRRWRRHSEAPRDGADGAVDGNERGGWLASVVGAPGGGSTPGERQPGVLERLKNLLTETSRSYEKESSSQTSGAGVVETERRLNREARDRSEAPLPVRGGPLAARTSRASPASRRASPAAATRASPAKRKRGDTRERKRKLAYEARCREILERIFQRPFPKTRPAWLRNELRDARTGTGTMHKLELDCYDGGSLALEYNGRQHRVYPNTWHETKKEFEDQQKRDRLKVVRCREEGVKLIIVPDSELVHYDDLYEYITEQLEELGLVQIED